MRIFQSSSFKIVCALVVPALLANAIPQSFEKRGEDETVSLVLFGNAKGDMNDTIKQYPEVKLKPMTNIGVTYSVVGEWVGDGNAEEDAVAIKDDDKEGWAHTLEQHKNTRMLLAAGYDNKDPQGWWTIIGHYAKKRPQA